MTTQPLSSIFLLLVLSLVAGESTAGIPDPTQSTCPPAVGIGNGSTCFDVVVRDFTGAPVSGATVEIDFGLCALPFCLTQPLVGNSVFVTANGSGLAHVCICATMTTPACTATIRANGVQLCTLLFDPQIPVVNVIAPNGAENWAVGTQYAVTWTATDDVGVVGVDIFYRAGNGTGPWTQIAQDLSNTGSFQWTVPNTPTTQAKVQVRARDAEGRAGADSSDNVFTINDPQIPVVTVVAPNGAESWTGGTQQSITWTATDDIAVTGVDIFWRDSESASWTPVAQLLGNSGTYDWTVPNTPTSQARVRVEVRDADSHTAADQSDNLFTILADPRVPVVTVVAPNGGEFWSGGTQHAITWTATDDVAVTGVDIFYRDSEVAPWTPVAQDLGNPGTYDWTVPSIGTAQARVRIEARDADGRIGADASNNVFTILYNDVQAPVVTVTAPNGGESWTGGTQHDVTWTVTDDVGVAGVDVFYRDGETARWTQVARAVPNPFPWFVPNTPTTQARVRVVARDAAGNAGEDVSDNVFTIVRTPTPLHGVATTLRDFTQPGTQPFFQGQSNAEGADILHSVECVACHGSNAATMPSYAFSGAMMAQSARDPLFYACLAIAEQDAPSSGDLCIRCHSPVGWLSGHSQPTNGALLDELDRDGVTCNFCHRAVDPIDQAGVSPAEDDAILADLLPAHTPTGYSNAQYVIDPQDRRRGPFDLLPGHAHGALSSAFHRSSDFCGTCHDVSNPVFERVGTSSNYTATHDQPAPLIAAHALMPLERTYSEWKNSAFPAGVLAPDFAGNKPGGMVSTCQDCHMPDVSGQGCVSGPLRPDVSFHDFTGGNAWIPGIIAQTYPGETNAAALADAAGRATSMLQKAALLTVHVSSASNPVAKVVVTNRTGHKLPTGYPEGRRMWLNVKAFDAANVKVYESGAYDGVTGGNTGVLTLDPDIVVYEAKLGLSSALAASLDLPAGPAFHFTLADRTYKDNRIPPQGFTNAAFDAFGGAPVDPSRPYPRFANGQYSDTSTYTLPASTKTVEARLYYQTASKEYVEFLLNTNTMNKAGQAMYDLWNTNGKSEPVLMNTATRVHWITATLGPGGAISSGGVAISAEVVTVPQGDSRTFVIASLPGYVAHVRVDGVLVGPRTEYTFENVTSDHTIDVRFGLAGVRWGLPVNTPYYAIRPKNPRLVSDGAGGAIIAWRDSAFYSGHDIMAQHVLPSGIMDRAWPLTGPGGALLVTPRYYAYGKSDPVLAPDGDGGAFIAWTEWTNQLRTFGHIRVQHVLSSGTLDSRWGPYGRTVTLTQSGDQRDPAIAADGSGGVFITWRELRNSTVYYDIFVQHLQASGAQVPFYSDYGLSVCVAGNDQRDPRIIADETGGGAIITWRDDRSGSGDIYAQRVLGNFGSIYPGWPTDGRALCSFTGVQTDPLIVSDKAGGAIVTWTDYRNGSSGPHVYAQRVLGSGAVDPAWPVNGLGVFGVTHGYVSGQYTPAVASDGAGGVIVASRDELSEYPLFGIYVRHVLGSGTFDPQWPSSQKLVRQGQQWENPGIVSDMAGGAIVTSMDNNLPFTPIVIHAQRIARNYADGYYPGWNYGVRLSGDLLTQANPNILSDNANGAIVVWDGNRAGGPFSDIYAQRVTAAGVVVPPQSPSGAIADGLPVSTAPGVQQNPTIVNDAQGGAILAWEDARSAATGTPSGAPAGGPRGTVTPLDAALVGGPAIYSVRLDASGQIPSGWPSAGRALSSVTSNQTEPVSVRDNTGGAIVVWKDDRNGNFDLFAQRVDASGTNALGWPPAGLPVTTATGNQQRASAVPDGGDGVIVFWEDDRSGTFDIYAQRLTSAGLIATGWGTGRAICTASGDQRNPVARPDGSGGAIVSWEDHRDSTFDIYAMRVTSNGVPATGWAADGRALCLASGDQTDPTIAGDDMGGALVAWQDARGLDSDIYAQYVTGMGTIATGWTADGNALCVTNGAQQHPSLAPDGVGGVIVAWEDDRSGVTSGFDLYAQHVGGDGAIDPGWTPNGNAFCIATGDQLNVSLVTDGGGGAIASWEDGRAGNPDIYATQITASGAIDSRWTPNGTPLCEANGGQTSPAIIGDGLGGAIVAWTDGRVSEADIYAMHVSGVSSSSPTAVLEPVASGVLRLLAPRPNPSGTSTEIAFELPASERVDLDIVDMAGRRVRTLVQGETLPPGRQVATWDGSDSRGVRVNPGVYFVSLRAAGRLESRRIVRLR